MAADRAEILRNAEKLLRQGKLQAAIAEYVRVVTDNPRDWNSANTLGDLYLRAGRRDDAIEQFRKIADSLSRDGFLSKASALYKKILKIRPIDEQALAAAAEIAAAQGVLVDARGYLSTLIEQRLARGDREGAAKARSRLAQIDPADLDGRRSAVRAQMEAGDRSSAQQVERKALAEALLQRGRALDAIEVLMEAAALDADDGDVKGRLFDAYLAHGDITRASQLASTPDQFKALAQAAVARGQDFESAAQFLGGRGDREVLFETASLYLRAGNTAEAVQLLRRVCEKPDTDLNVVSEWVMKLPADLSASLPPLMSAVVDAAVVRKEWSAAAALLEASLPASQDPVPALLRLVEIAFDGGLDQVMDRAQARLADEYLASGAAPEARVVVENLLLRQPDEPSHRERLRQALALLGEEEPDLLLGETLDALTDSLDDVSGATPSEVKAAAETPSATDDRELVEAIEAIEIDLTTMLDDFRVELHTGGSDGPAVPAPAGGADLDEVFEQLRDEASKRSDVETAQQEYGRGLRLLDEGLIEESIGALRAASRAPQFRFPAAASLGRLYRNRGELAQAIEWFERAVEAPAPTAEEIHAIFYELADALETGGEVARALAVCLELQAAAGDYRDVAERIDRLGKVQTRG